MKKHITVKGKPFWLYLKDYLASGPEIKKELVHPTHTGEEVLADIALVNEVHTKAEHFQIRDFIENE